MVLGKSLAQAVKAFSDGFLPRSRKRLGTSIHLDARNNALRYLDIGHRSASRAFLADGLVLHDHAADELGGTRRREEHLAVGAPALLGRWDSERIEALGQGRDGLVGGENSFLLGNQRQRDALQVVPCHGSSDINCFLSAVPVFAGNTVYWITNASSTRHTAGREKTHGEDQKAGDGEGRCLRPSETAAPSSNQQGAHR